MLHLHVLDRFGFFVEHSCAGSAAHRRLLTGMRDCIALECSIVHLASHNTSRKQRGIQRWTITLTVLRRGSVQSGILPRCVCVMYISR